MTLQTITLGGGCFWCTEAVFDRVRGITDVESGYTNGHTINPTYEQICQGDTGHAVCCQKGAGCASKRRWLARRLRALGAVHRQRKCNQHGKFRS